MSVVETERTFIPLSEAARAAGYTDHATLRQAITRGRMKGELRSNDLGFTYYVTTWEWLLEYLENRPQQADRRYDRALTYILQEGGSE